MAKAEAAPPPAGPDELPRALVENLGLLDPAELALANGLVSCGQRHLFDGWDAPGAHDKEKHAFLDQLAALDATFPGGIRGYVETVRCNSGADPFAKWTPEAPEAPEGVLLKPFEGEYLELEERGLQDAVYLAFIISAGETSRAFESAEAEVCRPVEISTGATLLQVYCQHIAALQQLLKLRLGRAIVLPVLIVVSDTTAEPLQELLRAQTHFGLTPSQITVLKQPRVATFAAGDGCLLATDGPYSVRTQPLGPGAVHLLISSSGLAHKWAREGVRWLLFMHDAAPLHLPTYLAALGAAAARQLDLCFTATPYRAHSGVDVLAQLRSPDSRRALVAVDGELLMRKSAGGKQTRALQVGCCANAFLARLEPYAEALRQTAGVVGDVAPRGGQLAPMRVHDYAWMVAGKAKAGFVSQPAEYGASPCLHDLKTAATLSAKAHPPCSAATAEMAVYLAHSAALRAVGAQVAAPRERSFHGVRVALGPSVVLHPTFAPSMASLRHKLVSPGAVRISERSTLILRGHNLSIESLVLDGTLEVSVADCASLRIRSLNVTNEGWQFDELSAAVQDSADCPPLLRQRGYTLRKRAQRRLLISSAGAFEVVHGELMRVGDELEVVVAPMTPHGSGGTPRATPTYGMHSPFGGPIRGCQPPPPSAVWSSASLELAPASSLSVPLVLREPSVASIEVKPNGSGLWLALLPQEGPPLLAFSAVRANGRTEEVHVPGSGVYTVQVENRNLLTPVCFSAKVEHVPADDFKRLRLQEALAARCEELKLVQQQDGELAASEAELARRLWEVQEARRRHEAMQKQLQSSIQAITESL